MTWKRFAKSSMEEDVKNHDTNVQRKLGKGSARLTLP